MPLPDYKGGSVVNLMSSLLNNMGDKSQYEQVPDLDPKLFDAKNVVLMVMDGMGFEFLKKHGKNTLLYKNMERKLTSVFPSATSPSITTFGTGLAPKNHGVTGWYMWMKEAGTIGIPLRFVTRSGFVHLTEFNLHASDIFSSPKVTEMVNRESYCIQPENIVDSDYSKNMWNQSEHRGYEGIHNYFEKIRLDIQASNKNKYIYAYYPDIDSLSHEFGMASDESAECLKEMDSQFRKFIDDINGTDTTLLITADHGLNDVSEQNRFDIEDHPKMQNCLSLPLCGESRTKYCYTRMGKHNEFKKYVKKNFPCKIYESKELIKKDYFGLFEQHPNLMERLGDYTIIMDEDYSLSDTPLGKEKSDNIGRHGGLSDEETIVPLITMRA